MAVERIERTVDDDVGHQGTRAVMDQHQLGRGVREAFQAVPHRLLPRRAAGDRREQRGALRGTGAITHRLVVERPVGEVDHHPHPVDAGVRGKSLHAVAEHCAPCERAVLLGQRPADPVAAPGGDDQGSGGDHAVSLVPAAGLEPATP